MHPRSRSQELQPGAPQEMLGAAGVPTYNATQHASELDYLTELLFKVATMRGRAHVERSRAASSRVGERRVE